MITIIIFKKRRRNICKTSINNKLAMLIDALSDPPVKESSGTGRTMSTSVKSVLRAKTRLSVIHTLLVKPAKHTTVKLSLLLQCVRVLHCTAKTQKPTKP